MGNNLIAAIAYRVKIGIGLDMSELITTNIVKNKNNN